MYLSKKGRLAIAFGAVALGVGAGIVASPTVSAVVALPLVLGYSFKGGAKLVDAIQHKRENRRAAKKNKKGIAPN